MMSVFYNHLILMFRGIVFSKWSNTLRKTISKGLFWNCLRFLYGDGRWVNTRIPLLHLSISRRDVAGLGIETPDS